MPPKPKLKVRMKKTVKLNGKSRGLSNDLSKQYYWQVFSYWRFVSYRWQLSEPYKSRLIIHNFACVFFIVVTCQILFHFKKKLDHSKKNIDHWKLLFDKILNSITKKVLSTSSWIIDNNYKTNNSIFFNQVLPFFAANKGYICILRKYVLFPTFFVYLFLENIAL